MRRKVVTLDVREDLRNGREPFSQIMQTVGALRPDQDLLLIAPFEPVPLYAVLQNRGLAHESKLTSTGDWEILFTPAGTEEPAGAVPKPTGARNATTSGQGQSRIVEVDARGLEPPQPLVTILEAVAALPAGSELRALTDRRPMHLYPQLEERGFTGETTQHDDGSFITHIRAR
ncbi:MAG TPA: DUF2249 domain-containing protein [Clostridia bacterium]|nr:DUF2249 domain-containing protein [Clostridia bacterium]